MKQKNKKLIGLGIAATTVVTAAAVIGGFVANKNKLDHGNSEVFKSAATQGAINPTIVANPTVATVASQNYHGSYKGLSPAITATLDFREAIIDAHYFVESGVTKIALLSAFSQGQGEIGIRHYDFSGSSTFSKRYKENEGMNKVMNQKIRIFKYENDLDFWTKENEIELSNSVFNMYNKWDADIFRYRVGTSRTIRWYSNVFSKISVSNGKIIIYGDNGGVSIFNKPAISTTSKTHDWLTQSVGSSAATSMFLHNTSATRTGQSINASTNTDAPGTFKYTTNGTNIWLDTAIKAKLETDYKDYQDNNWNTKAFIELKDGSYLFGGEGEYLAKVSQTGTISNRQYGIFQGQDKIDFKGTIQTVGTNSHYHAKYTQQFVNNWSSSVNKFLKLSDDTILAFGGLNRTTGFVRKINTDGTVSASAATSLPTSIIDAVQLGNGSIIAIGTLGIYEINPQTLTVVKTINSGTFLNNQTGTVGNQFLSKIVLSADGGYTVLSRDGELTKADLANAYMSAGGATSFFNNGTQLPFSFMTIGTLFDGIYVGEIQGASNWPAYFPRVVEPFREPFQNESFLPSTGGNPLAYSPTALTFFNESGSIIEQNTDWGSLDYADGNMPLTDMTGINDIYLTPDGEYLTIHNDGKFRKLDQNGSMSSWVSTNSVTAAENGMINVNFTNASGKILGNNSVAAKVIFGENKAGISVSTSGIKALFANANEVNAFKDAKNIEVTKLTNKIYLAYEKGGSAFIVKVGTTITATNITLGSTKTLEKMVGTTYSNENKIYFVGAFSTDKKIESGIDLALYSYDTKTNVIANQHITIDKNKFENSTGNFVDLFNDSANGNIVIAFTTSNTTTNPIINFWSSNFTNYSKWSSGVMSFTYNSTKVSLNTVKLGQTIDEYFQNFMTKKVYNVLSTVSTNNILSSDTVSSTETKLTGGQILKSIGSKTHSITYSYLDNNRIRNGVAIASGKSIGAISFRGAELIYTNSNKKMVFNGGGSNPANKIKLQNNISQLYRQNMTAIHSAAPKIDFSSNEYSHFIPNDFEISSFISDGYGGFYVAGKKVIVRLNRDFQLINYTYMNDMNDIVGLSLDSISNLIVTDSDQKAKYLNPLLSDQGYVDFTKSSTLYTSFAATLTSEINKANSDAWYNSHNKDLARLDKKVVKVPTNSNKPLSSITFTGDTLSGVKIDESKVWSQGIEKITGSFNNVTEKEKIQRNFYKDVEVQYSFDGWTNSNGQKVWVIGSGSQEPKDIFSDLLKPGVVSSANSQYTLTASQKNNFDLTKIQVRFGLKSSTTFDSTVSFENALQTPVNLSSTNYPQGLTQTLSLIDPASTVQSQATQLGENNATLWTTFTRENPDSQSFTYVAKDNTRLINSGNFKMILPSQLSTLNLFNETNGALEVKYATTSNATEWVADASTLKFSGDNQNLYYSIFVKDNKQNSAASTISYKWQNYTLNNQTINVAYNGGTTQSIPRKINGFQVPIVLEDATIKQIKVSKFTGSTKDISWIDDSDTVLSTKSKANTEIVYAFGPKATYRAVYNGDAFDKDLFRGSNGAAWNTRETIQNLLKIGTNGEANDPLLASLLTPDTILLGRVRLKQNVNDGSVVPNDVMTVYNGFEQGAATDNSKFTIYNNVQSFFSKLNLTSGLVASGISNEELVLIDEGASFNFPQFYAKNDFWAGKDSAEATKGEVKLQRQLNENGTPVTFKINGQEFWIKINPKSGYSIDNEYSQPKQLKAKFLAAITDLDLNKLQNVTLLNIFGDSYHFNSSEADGLFNYSKTDGLTTKDLFKNNLYVGYRFGTTDKALPLKEFQGKIKSMSNEEINNLDIETLNVTYQLTENGLNEFAFSRELQSKIAAGVKPSIQNLKKHITVADFISPSVIKSGFNLIGTTENLTIQPVVNSPFDTNFAQKIGYKIQYGTWKTSGNTATYSYSDTPPTTLNLNVPTLSSYSNWSIQKASDGTVVTTTPTEDILKQIFILGFRFVTLDPTKTNIGLSNRTISNATSDTQREYGYQIDHTSIKQLIAANNDVLAAQLNFSGDISTLNANRSQIEFEKGAFDALPNTVTDTQKTLLEIQYSFGQAEPNTWVTYNDFLTNIRSYQLSNNGPITFDTYPSSAKVDGLTNQGVSVFKARWRLRSSVDSSLYEIPNANIANDANLSVSQVVSDFDISQFVINLLNRQSIANGSSASINSLEIPFTGTLLNRFQTLNDFINFMRNRMGVEILFNAPGVNNTYGALGTINSLGSTNKLNVRISYVTNAPKYFKAIVSNEANKNGSNGTIVKSTINSGDAYTIQVDVKVPVSIQVNSSELSQISITGNTRNVSIQEATETAALSKLSPENKNRVTVVYAIGTSESNLVPITASNDKWLPRQKFIDALLEYTGQFSFDNRQVFMRYALKEGASPADFAVSDASSIKSSNVIKLYADINNYIQAVTSNAPTFGVQDTSSKVTSIVLGFSQAGAIDELKAINVGIEYSTSATGTWNKLEDLNSENPVNLGNPPKLFVRFVNITGPNQANTVLSRPSDSNANASAPIDLVLSNLAVTINAGSQEIIDSVRLSGNTKNIEIDETIFEKNYSFAYFKSNIEYGIQLLQNTSSDSTIEADLVQFEGFDKWMSSTQLKQALVANNSINIFLNRNGATSSNSSNIAQNYRIVARLSLKESTQNDPTSYKFQDSVAETSTIKAFTSEKLASVKSFIRTNNFASELAVSSKGHRITFGASTSADKITGIDFINVGISEGQKAVLKDQGIQLNLAFGSNLITTSNINWNSDLTTNVQNLGNPRKLTMQFGLIDKTALVEIENTSIITLQGDAQLVVPVVITTDVRKLSGITLSGSTNDLTINSASALSAIDESNRSRVQVQYSIGQLQSLVPIQNGSADVWFSEASFISFLKTYNKNIQRSEFVINARYALATNVDSDSFAVSSSSSRTLSTTNVSLFVDVSKESFYSTLVSGSLVYPNAVSNLELGEPVNPFTDAQKKFFSDNVIQVEFSTTSETKGFTITDITQLPKSITTLPPRVWFRYGLVSGTQIKTILSEASKKAQLMTVPGTRSIPIDATRTAAKINLSGNTVDLVINEDELRKEWGEFVSGSTTIMYALKNTVISGVEAYQFVGQNFYTKDQLLAFLKTNKNNIVGSDKAFYATFRPSNPSVEIKTTNNLQNFAELGSTNVLSYLHIQDLIDELKQNIATTSDSNTNTSLGELELPFTDSSRVIYNNLLSYGLGIEWNNNGTLSNGVWTPDPTKWSSTQPVTTVNNGSQNFIFVRFVARVNSSVFVPEVSKTPIQLQVKSLITIREATSASLAALNFNGNTRDLVITGQQELINSLTTDQSKRNALEVQYSIGPSNAQIELTAGKIWYTQGEFLQALKSYPVTIYNKQITARWAIKAADAETYFATGQNIVVNNTTGVNDAVKIFVQKSSIDLRLAMEINGNTQQLSSSIVVGTTIPIGLKVQYSLNNGAEAVWTDSLPTTLDSDRTLFARFAALDGYVYEDTTVYTLDTSRVLEAITIRNRLSTINLGGNLRDLTINDDAAYEGVGAGNLRDLVQIKYSISGTAINGASWFTKDQFIALLKTLKGSANNNTIILRNSIVARYDFANGSNNRFVMRFPGQVTDGVTSFTSVDETTIDTVGAEFIQQLITPDLNSNVKGYIDTSTLLSLGLADLTITGTNNDPTLNLHEKFLNFLTNYNTSQPLRIVYSSNVTDAGIDFNGAITLFNQDSTAVYQPAFNLNSNPKGNNQAFRLNENAIGFGFRFTANTNYDIGTNGTIQGSFDYRFADNKINILTERNVVRATAPSLTLVNATDGSTTDIYQGKGKAIVKDSASTLEDDLAYWYLISSTTYSDAQLEQMVKTPSLWTKDVPSNLKVGDLVYVKIDVTDPSKYLLVNSTNYFSKTPLVVTNLILDTTKINVDTAKIGYGSNNSRFNNSFSGLSRFTLVPMVKDTDFNFAGVDLTLNTTLKFIRDADGNIQFDQSGAPIVERSGSTEGPAVLLRNGTQAKDSTGKLLFLTGAYETVNGITYFVPGAPVVGDAIVQIQLEDPSLSANFIQATGTPQNSLFRNQQVYFTYKVRNGYRLASNNNTWEKDTKVDYTVTGVKYRIEPGELGLQLQSLNGNYAVPAGRSDQNPVSGFAQLADDALSATFNNNGTLSTITVFSAINNQLKTIQPVGNLRLRMTVNRVSNNLGATVYDDLSNTFPTNLANNDEINVSIVSDNPDFAYESLLFSLTVSGLAREIDINNLIYVRMNPGGEFDKQGSFEVLSTNPQTREQLLPAEFHYEYALIRKGEDYTQNDSRLTWSKSLPKDLANGDLVKWRLAINSDGLIANNFANRVATPLGSQNLETVKSKVMNNTGRVDLNGNAILEEIEVDGYLINSLKTVIDVGDFNASKLDELILTYRGDNGVASLFVDASKITLPPDTELKFYKIDSQGVVSVITDLINAQLSNGDRMRVELVVTALAQAQNKELPSTYTSSNDKYIVSELPEPNSIFGIGATIGIAVASIFGAIGLSALAYVLIRKFKLGK
ncbi:hypothetical protein EI74_0475 [Mycoplasma testudineum]|uniref:Uncharacterized protein n=1 Tax=Mycoplasma testudineum TaxID=244584 RepID=A0A4R6IFH9_9MOLU|nr:hypothetical protein [Mycoplasma testudineum]OYD26862.1 hypothetical protein CG473_01995 [Mycoplasma testudineum]TDO20397.1 hypothetical protein EI74_0475 [Mycoplasma testudineum]